MKYFLDFESTQHAQRIISIGCVSEKGESFYTLVKLTGKDKVSKFITDLTGITEAELEEKGVPADEAFEALFNFIDSTREGQLPEYYCYGDCDKKFCLNTIKYMQNLKSISFVMALGTGMIDFSRQVKSFFKLNSPFGLRRLYCFFNDEDAQQSHNALEDAKMLAFVVNKFNQCKIEDAEEIKNIPSNHAKNESKAPALFIQWPADKWAADTGANGNTEWQYVAIAGTRKKYFNDIDTLVMWIIRYMTTGISIKKADQVAKVKEKIKQSLKDGKARYNCIFTKRKENDNA